MIARARAYLKKLASLAAMITLAGCGHSPPTQFFTLDPVPSAAPAYGRAGPFQVNVVHIPPVLDRLSMVRETGADQVVISDQDKWAAPLGGLIRNALAADLMRRLSPGSVVLPDAPVPPGTRVIAVDIEEFRPDSSGTVVLDANWSVLDANSAAPALRRHVRLTSAEPAASPDRQAVAMSGLLGQLADGIAQAAATK